MKYLSNYMEEKQTLLFNETGSFFAFGNAQFEEQKKEGVKYVDMGYGLICPKETAEKLSKGLDLIYIEAIKQDVEENGAKKIIEREYFNHETQITMDNSSVIGYMSGYAKQFPEQFSADFILSVCRDCFKKAVENDWF